MSEPDNRGVLLAFPPAFNEHWWSTHPHLHDYDSTIPAEQA